MNACESLNAGRIQIIAMVSWSGECMFGPGERETVQGVALIILMVVASKVSRRR